MAITGSTRVAGVIGWPVSHSRSPRLHNYWLAKHAIDGVYVPMQVRPGKLHRAFKGLVGLGFAGANITVPHKEEALALVDRVAPLAKRIGAINTVVVMENGAIEGRNTDAFGFVAGLRQAAPGWQAGQGPAAVLGAGGAARAIVVALLDEGCTEIRLYNRSRERADKLVEEFGPALKARDWDSRDRGLDGATLLVNATSLGMAGQAELDIDLRLLPRSAVVNDIVYSPLETRLIAAARARGNKAVDGLGMLLHQACPSFHAWFGVHPEVTPELRAHILAGMV